ncbi:MAG: NADH-quinone oxidoreductase subunit C [Thaumarchaeota archaeon]|nr:NADH-quinone oxidoreductase subunit C [Nitrososphaerota archaeon]
MSAQSSLEQSLVQQLSSQFKDSVRSSSFKAKRFKITVDETIILKVAEYIRDQLGFDHAASVTGTDFPKDGVIEVVYHFTSYSKDDLRKVVGALAVRIPRDSPKIPSLINVWPSVEYHERETYEMLGVTFEGHPNLKRLLLPEDWSDIPPLRKDFTLPGR